jgi:hypothetical protein
MKQIAMLKKTIAQSQLSLDQVRKAVNDVESRLKLMEKHDSVSNPAKEN